MVFDTRDMSVALRLSDSVTLDNKSITLHQRKTSFPPEKEVSQTCFPHEFNKTQKDQIVTISTNQKTIENKKKMAKPTPIFRTISSDIQDVIETRMSKDQNVNPKDKKSKKCREKQCEDPAKCNTETKTNQEKSGSKNVNEDFGLAFL